MKINIFKPEMTDKTPSGQPCWIPGPVLADLIRKQARGNYQASVAENLIRNGYIVTYLADGGQLKGNAARYKGRYEQSVQNLMTRIEEHLPGTLEIKSGEVGPKGGHGYWLVI